MYLKCVLIIDRECNVMVGMLEIVAAAGETYVKVLD